MVRHEIAHPLEPERRELRQDLALVGNAGAEHVIERGDAIGGDDEQRRFAGRERDVVDVAHLAAPVKRETVERCFEQGRSGEHR